MHRMNCWMLVTALHKCSFFNPWQKLYLFNYEIIHYKIQLKGFYLLKPEGFVGKQMSEQFLLFIEPEETLNITKTAIFISNYSLFPNVYVVVYKIIALCWKRKSKAKNSNTQMHWEHWKIWKKYIFSNGLLSTFYRNLGQMNVMLLLQLFWTQLYIFLNHDSESWKCLPASLQVWLVIYQVLMGSLTCIFLGVKWSFSAQKNKTKHRHMGMIWDTYLCTHEYL